MLRKKFFATVFGLIATLCSPARAEKIPEKLAKAYENEAADTIFIGKAAPVWALAELRKAAAELKAARKALKGELGKGCTNYESAKAGLLALEAKVNRATKELQEQGEIPLAIIGALASGIEKMRKDFEFARIAVADHLKLAFDSIGALREGMQKIEKVLKAKQWGVGIHVATSFDYRLGKDDWGQYDIVGLGAYWMSEQILISADVGAGVSAIGKAGAWACGVSIEWRWTEQFSIGGGFNLTQDLGNYEGAVRTNWAVGPKLRYRIGNTPMRSFAIGLTPIQLGAGGKRGYGQHKPSWDYDLGALLTLDYYLL